MENEQAKIIEALQQAIQMEVDGKEFYQQAGQKSSNQLIKELFRYLADQEDTHRKKFWEIYEAIVRGQIWPDVEPPTEKGQRFKSIFAQATEELGSKVKVAESELEAIKTAMDMETRTCDFYISRSEQSNLLLEKKFYQALVAEEREHYLSLLDSYEYLADPAGWFIRKEHWSLDGA